MTDEALPIEAPPTPQEPTASEQPVETAAAAPAAEAAATFDWQTVLEKVDPKELRKHPLIAGVVGSELQQERQRDAERRRVEAEAKAAQQEQERLRTMAREDPIAFAELWQSEDQRRAYQNQIEAARYDAQAQHGKALGEAYNDILVKMSEEEREKLRERMAAQPTQAQMYQLFAREMAKIEVQQLVAAEKAKAAAREAEVAKKEHEAGRQAGRQEGAAESFRNTEAPGLAKPRGAPSGVNYMALTDEESLRRWKQEHG